MGFVFALYPLVVLILCERHQRVLGLSGFEVGGTIQNLDLVLHFMLDMDM